MGLIEEPIVMEKKCSACMYYQNRIYCIRKKQETKEEDYCLHYVNVNDRHSIVGVSDPLLDILFGNFK